MKQRYDCYEVFFRSKDKISNFSAFFYFSERLMSSPKSGATSSSSHVTTNPGHGGSYLDQSPVQHRQPERRTSTNPFTTTSRSIAVIISNLFLYYLYNLSSYNDVSVLKPR